MVKEGNTIEFNPSDNMQYFSIPGKPGIAALPSSSSVTYSCSCTTSEGCSTESTLTSKGYLVTCKGSCTGKCTLEQSKRIFVKALHIELEF